MKKRRLINLCGALAILALGDLAMNLYRPPAPKPKPLWLTEERFYKFIDGTSLDLPGGRQLTLHRESVQSLRIEHGGKAPESDAANVSFIVSNEDVQYVVQSMVSLHNFDGNYDPIVNLGQGWSMTEHSPLR